VKDKKRTNEDEVKSDRCARKGRREKEKGASLPFMFDAEDVRDANNKKRKGLRARSGEREEKAFFLLLALGKKGGREKSRNRSVRGTKEKGGRTSCHRNSVRGGGPKGKNNPASFFLITKKKSRGPLELKKKK